MNNLFIKANRVFTPLRKYAFFYTLFVAFVGLFYPIVGVSVLLVILGLLSVSFFKGRFWCGNICAHGSLFDSLLFRYSRNIKVPKLFKSKLLVYAFFIYFSYNVGSGLVRVSALYGETIFYERLGYIFVRSYLMVTLAGGFFALVHAPRTWCHICPMGVMQKGSYAVGKFLKVAQKTDQKITIESKDMCHTCGKCYRVCPMQLAPYLNFSNENQFDDANCLRCNTCVAHCPAGILSLSTAKEAKSFVLKDAPYGYEERTVFQSKLIAKNMLKDDVLELHFSLKADDEFAFTAGQFVLVKITESPLMYRAFSVSSFDQEENTLSVTVKRAPNGFGSSVLFEKFKVGDDVMLEGPMGNELMVDKQHERIVLVAGGIGITPFVEIVKDLLKSKNETPHVTLVYGVNTKDEFLYEAYFDALASAHANFEFVKVVANDKTFDGIQGFVTDALKTMALDESKIYMCGPKPMTQATIGMLKRIDFDMANVAYESA